MSKPHLNRRGRIRIIHPVFDNWRDLLSVFAEFVPTKAESDFLGEWIEYTGLSGWFDELEDGETVPFYTAELQKIDGRVRLLRFKREK